MKKFSIAMLALGVFGLFASPASATTYNWSFDGDRFDVDAVVTTDASDIVTNITGTMFGPNGYSTLITDVVAASSNQNGIYWLWNNKFTADAPHVDLYGILWQNLDGSLANYYLDNGNYVLSTANPSTGDFSNWQNLDVGQASVSAVPLPPALALLGTGLLGLAVLGRRRKLR